MMTLLTTRIILQPQETILGTPSGLQKSLLILGLLVSLWFPSPPQPRSHPDSLEVAYLRWYLHWNFKEGSQCCFRATWSQKFSVSINKLVLKGPFWFAFCLECCTVLRKYIKMKVHLHLFCKSLVTGTLCSWETEVQTYRKILQPALHSPFLTLHTWCLTYPEGISHLLPQPKVWTWAVKLSRTQTWHIFYLLLPLPHYYLLRLLYRFKAFPWCPSE